LFTAKSSWNHAAKAGAMSTWGRETLETCEFAAKKIRQFWPNLLRRCLNLCKFKGRINLHLLKMRNIIQYGKASPCH